jgi:ubiquinone/menaquinone biosynthesis C-methylase UbiE
MPHPYRLFNYFAPFYEWLVSNAFWRESVREMARHLPPSGSTLRVLDVGCGPGNSALTLASLRADVQVLGLDGSTAMISRARRAIAKHSNGKQVSVARADIQHLPIADSSIDAMIAHSVYYMLDDQAGFLTEALRVLRPGGRLIMLDPAQVPYPLGMLRKNLRAAPSVLIWQIVSRAYHRYTPERIARELEAAGLARVLGERAVQGYGVLSRGEKPYTNLSPIERTAQVAAKDSVLASARHIFLLIKQTPNKPAWALQPSEVITWGAAAVLDTNGTPTALAFSSLPKAVAFMQPAVTNGQIVGVTKVAKFGKAQAQRWDFPILLNPTPEHLETEYRWSDIFIAVDPNTAITGEE